MALPSFARCGFLSLLIVGLLGLFGQARAEAWPFDQRQILLGSIEGQGFPDTLTTAQIMDVFVQRGRVRWVTQKAGKQDIVPIEIPSDFAWQSARAVRNVGLKYQVDGIVVVVARGSQIDLRWYASLDGQPLFFESLYLPNAGASIEAQQVRKKRLQAWLMDMWAKIPGQGYVVKRDLSTLQIEGVLNEGLKVGDRVELVRLQELQRHPVLKTLVGMKSSPTGYASITKIGDPFSEALIEYESELDPIREGDRYSLKSTPPVALAKAGENKTDATGENKKAAEDEELPRMVDLGVRLGWASIAHKEKTGVDNYNLKDSAPALSLYANFFLTSAWIAGVQTMMARPSFTDVPTAYGGDSISGKLSNLQIFTGYRMLLPDYFDLGNSELSFMAGYRRFRLSLDAPTTTQSPTSKTYSGLYLALSYELPILDKILFRLGLSRVMGTALSEEESTSGGDSSNSLWDFDLQVAYKLDGRQKVGGYYQYSRATSDFEGQGSRSVAAERSDISASQIGAFYQYQF